MRRRFISRYGMSRRSISGVCPNCNKEMLVIVGTTRDYTDWQTKYTIQCELCGYQFSSDEKMLDSMLTLLKEKEQKKQE